MFDEKIFYGLNCAEKFFSYLISSEVPKGSIVMAHNGQAYDFYFVLKQFYKNSSKYVPNLVINGTLLMQMLVKTTDVELKFIDSVNFIPAPLRKFPTLFGFNDSKTFFPYSFVNEETIYYRGVIPARTFYDVPANETLSFNEFYEQQQQYANNNNQQWDLESVAIQYCCQDVHVLFCGIFTYLKTFYEVAKINPFS